MKNDRDKLLVFTTFLAGVATVVAVHFGLKVSNLEGKILDATKHISDLTSVDVQETIVQKAVSKVAEREVADTVRTVASKLRSDIHSEISSKVRAAVNDEFEAVRPEIASRLRKKVRELELTDILSEIQNSAEEQVMEKLEEKVDEFLEDHQFVVYTSKK